MAAQLTRKHLRRASWSVFGAAAVAAIGSLVQPAAAAGPDLIEGSWSGGGTVQTATGGRERARCHARVRRISDSVFGVSAVCATSSIRVAQTAEVRRVSTSEYAGRFHNDEYNIDGRMTITATKNTLRAALDSDQGSANLIFNR